MITNYAFKVKVSCEDIIVNQTVHIKRELTFNGQLVLGSINGRVVVLTTPGEPPSVFTVDDYYSTDSTFDFAIDNLPVGTYVYWFESGGKAYSYLVDTYGSFAVKNVTPTPTPVPQMILMVLL